MKRMDDIQTYVKKNNLTDSLENFLDLQNEKILDMINQEKESLEEINKNIIIDGIYKDESKNEEEREKFCRYFAKMDRHERCEHTNAIVNIKNDRIGICPVAYVFSQDDFDGVLFRYFKPNYENIEKEFKKDPRFVILSKTQQSERIKNFFEQNTKSFDSIIRTFENYQTQTNNYRIDLEKVTKIVTTNYTDKTFKIYEK